MRRFLIEVPDNINQIQDRCVIKIIKELEDDNEKTFNSNSKFKKGDIIVTKDQLQLLAVYEKTDYFREDCDKVVYYSCLCSPTFGVDYKKDISYGIGKEDEVELATYDQILQFEKSLRLYISQNTEESRILYAKKALKHVIKARGIKRFQDFIDLEDDLEGYYFSSNNDIVKALCKSSYNLFKEKKEVLSGMAMAKISMLLPYYGGKVREEDWKENFDKFCIVKNDGKIMIERHVHTKRFLSFYKEEDAKKFYEWNKELVEAFLNY